jgi:mono/diheme cytochrome c family protein
MERLKPRKTRSGSWSGSSSRTGTDPPKQTGLLALALSALLLGSCSREPPASSSAGGPKPRLGNVMVEVARRFETAGRAATGNRFELAEFEVGEIGELFEDDVPNAELPKEGPTAHISAVAKGFLEANVPELKKAAAAKDHDAFGAAFQRAASICNACHQAAAKGFIQVPSEPGNAVPDLDPLPAPSAKPQP